MGRSVKAVAATVEVLEESGLPPLCVAMADEEDARQPLGRVLAETVRVSSHNPPGMCHANAIVTTASKLKERTRYGIAKQVLNC